MLTVYIISLSYVIVSVYYLIKYDFIHDIKAKFIIILSIILLLISICGIISEVTGIPIKDILNLISLSNN